VDAKEGVPFATGVRDGRRNEGGGLGGSVTLILHTMKLKTSFCTSKNPQEEKVCRYLGWTVLSIPTSSNSSSQNSLCDAVSPLMMNSTLVPR
jgi:hypothetical protein